MMVKIVDDHGVNIDLKTYLFNVERTIVIDEDITSDMANEILYSLKCLETLDDQDNVKVMIKSDGGNIQAGNEIIQAMGLCKKSITTIAFGDIKSMASNIFFAGDHRIIYPSSTILIHNPIYCSMENENLELSEITYLLNTSTKKKEELLDFLMSIDGLKLSREELSKMMDKEKVFSSKEAVEYGLAHEIATEL